MFEIIVVVLLVLIVLSSIETPRSGADGKYERDKAHKRKLEAEADRVAKAREAGEKAAKAPRK